MSDEDKDRRDELLAVASTLMSGWCNDGTVSVSDRFITEAVSLADRLIRVVDKFTGARVVVTPGDHPPFPLPDGYRFKRNDTLVGGWSITIDRGYGVFTGVGGFGEPTRDDWDAALAKIIKAITTEGDQ